MATASAPARRRWSSCALEHRSLRGRALASEGTYHSRRPAVGLENAGQEGTCSGLPVGAGDAHYPHGSGRVVPKRSRYSPQRRPDRRHQHLGDGDFDGVFAQHGDCASLYCLAGIVMTVGPAPGDTREQGTRADLARSNYDVSDLGVAHVGPPVAGTSVLTLRALLKCRSACPIGPWRNGPGSPNFVCASVPRANRHLDSVQAGRCKQSPQAHTRPRQAPSTLADSRCSRRGHRLVLPAGRRRRRPHLDVRRAD